MEHGIPTKIKFCPQCGSDRIETRFIDGRDRSVCGNCERVLYRNPVPSVLGVIWQEGEILLVKRGIEPGLGLWCLPGGFIEMGETTEEALEREIFEETALNVAPLNVLAVNSVLGGFYGDVLVLTYNAEITGGSIIAGDDATDVKFFKPDDLPLLAFEEHYSIIKLALKEIR